MPGSIARSLHRLGRDEYVGVDTICEMHWAGRRGFCDLEMSSNARAGRERPPLAIWAALTDGLTQRPREHPDRL